MPCRMTSDAAAQRDPLSMKAQPRSRTAYKRPAASVAALLMFGQIMAASPARAQGADDFLRDINSIGIGNPSDSKNFDLVGFGNALCWRLYSGEAPARVVDSVISDSRSLGTAGLTPQQAQAAVGFAHTDLCPDAGAGSVAH
jgi:hypothetical protein